MNRIAELRKANNYSQQKLAGLLSVARSTLAMWEIGASQPDSATLARIATIFNTTTDYLLGLSDTPEKEKAPSPEDALEATLEKYRNHPTQKALFSLTKNATPEDVDAAYEIAIAFLKGKGYIPNDDE